MVGSNDKVAITDEESWDRIQWPIDIAIINTCERIKSDRESEMPMYKWKVFLQTQPGSIHARY